MAVREVGGWAAGPESSHVLPSTGPSAGCRVQGAASGLQVCGACCGSRAGLAVLVCREQLAALPACLLPSGPESCVSLCFLLSFVLLSLCP